MLKSPNRNKKKTKRFICTCFMIVVLSLNIFYTFDIAMPQLSFSHEKSYSQSCIFHVCGNRFQMKCYIRQHKHPFLVPGLRLLLQKPKLQLLASLSSNHSLDLYLPKSLGPWKVTHSSKVTHNSTVTHNLRVTQIQKSAIIQESPIIQDSPIIQKSPIFQKSPIIQKSPKLHESPIIQFSGHWNFAMKGASLSTLNFEWLFF